jgi:hypothetical protein
MNSVKLQSAVTRTLLGATLGIATGLIALAGTATPSHAAGVKTAKKPVTHIVAKKTTTVKPKAVSTKHKITAKKTGKKIPASTKHTVKHSTGKHVAVNSKHTAKTMAKKPVHTTVKTMSNKPKVTTHKK